MKNNNYMLSNRYFLKEILKEWKKIFTCVCVLAIVIPILFTTQKDVSTVCTTRMALKPVESSLTKEYNQETEDILIRYFISELKSEKTRNDVEKKLSDRYKKNDIINIIDNMVIQHESADVISLQSSCDDFELSKSIMSAMINESLNRADNSSIISKDGFIMLESYKKEINEVGGNYIVMTFAGAFIGLMLSLFLIVLKILNDKHIKSLENANDLLEIPLLSTMPNEANYSSFNENKIWNKIFYSNKEYHTISVVSSIKNEGTTYISKKIIKAAKLSYDKILYIDCNFLNNKNNVLYSDGKIKLSDFSQIDTSKLTLSDFQNLNIFDEEIYVLSFDERKTFDERMLYGTDFSNFMLRIREIFDFIIIDCVPIEESLSIVPISHNSDGTILVVSTDGATRNTVCENIAMLKDSNVNLIGSIINRTDK